MTTVHESRPSTVQVNLNEVRSSITLLSARAPPPLSYGSEQGRCICRASWSIILHESQVDRRSQAWHATGITCILPLQGSGKARSVQQGPTLLGPFLTSSAYLRARVMHLWAHGIVDLEHSKTTCDDGNVPLCCRVWLGGAEGLWE